MKNYLFAAINQLSLLIGYVIIIAFARSLSLSEFGQLNYIKNIITLGMVTIWFGLERSSLFYLKTISVSKGIRSITSFKLCVSIFCFPVVCSLICLGIIEYSSLKLIIWLIGAMFLVTVFDIKYLFDFTKNVHLEILINLIKFIPLLSYIAFAKISDYSFKIEHYFLFWFAGVAGCVIVQYLYTQIKPAISISWKDIHRLFNVTGFVAGGVIASFLNNYADTFMIKHFLNLEMLGIYSAGYTLFLGLTMLTSCLMRFFVSENLKSGFSFKKTVKYAKQMFIVCSIVAVLVYLFSNMLIINLLGETYIEAVKILNILLFSFVLIGPTAVYGNILIVEGKTNFYMYSMLFAVLTNVILNCCFIPRYGIVAAAYTTGVSNLVAVITTFLFYRYKIILQRI